MGYPIEYHPPHEPPRLQGRRAAGRPEDRHRRVRGRVRRRFLPAGRFPARAPSTYFADPKVGRGADALELSEPRLQLPDGSGGHAARRPLHSGARRALARRATSSISTARPAFCARAMIDDAGGWQHDTLTEDSDLSYRAQLKGWRFVYLPGPGLPVGTAGGNARLPGAAIALGQGSDAGGQEAAAGDSEGGHPAPRQGRSLPAPHAEHFLPADDRGFGADAAGDDRALLHGRVGRWCSSICR